MKSESHVEKATKQYEKWLGRHTFIVRSDLRHKHKAMRESAFIFFRGTFYRWVELWDKARKDLKGEKLFVAKAPRILCVGDLHIENFGTWRDGEGRLAWGINDFDEIYTMHYTNDLVRLATSAWFAIGSAGTSWTLSHKDACRAILRGYGECLRQEGRAFVLAEGLPWLWNIATHPSRKPTAFWERLKAKTTQTREDKIPAPLRKDAARAIAKVAPADPTAQASNPVQRRAGVGSLGRPRLVQLFDGKLGTTVREAKAVLPSACVFAGQGSPIKRPYDKIMQRAIRIRDPFAAIVGEWSVRRLAFDSDKIELEGLGSLEEALDLFAAMGAETANIHLGSGLGPSIHAHLMRQNKRTAAWLEEASIHMAEVTQSDYTDFVSSDIGTDPAK